MRWLPLVLLTACSRSPAPKLASSAPALEVPLVPVDAGAPSKPIGCALVDDTTIDDGQGKVDEWGSMALHDVRILAHDDGTAVTWTRTAEPRTGDTYRSPYAAFRTGTDAFTRVDLPVRSYACATYGSVSPNTPELPFVFWGVLNSNAFEQFHALPKVKAPDTVTPSYTTPDRFVETPHQDVDVFVASHDVALAVLTEMSCDTGCQCSESWKDALWLRSLDPKRPFATRVASGKVDAPAFALSDKGGVAAWRLNKELFWLRVGADGKPIGTATSFAKGDVGAPAVAISGNDALVVWASRPSKDSAYQLQWMKLGSEARPIATTGSAFAPALIANEHAAVLAWMEGDGGKVGEIHVAPVTDGVVGASAVVSGTEPNARDPELSGSLDQPAIVWSTFTTEKAAGILRVGHLSCAK